MKFYIASKLENAEVVKRVADVLTAAGHTLTYDWTKHGSVKNAGQARITEVAELERAGVMDAQMVIVLLPGGRGTHTELGIGLAGNKPVLICAEDDSAFKQDESTCAFYWNYVVSRITGTMDVWLKEILARAQRIDRSY